MEKRKLSDFVEERLHAYRKLLDAIENIVRLQKANLRSDAELSRIDQVHHYDHKLVQETYKDPRLFGRKDDGNLRIERMYDSVPKETFDIFENRFAIALLLEADEDIRKALERERKGKENLAFLRSPLSFGPYGTYSLLKNYLLNAKEERSGKEKTIAALENLHRRKVYLSRSPFYQSVKKVTITNFQPTNLLLDQKDYRYCFDFYLQKKAQKDKVLSALEERIEKTLLEEMNGEKKDGKILAKDANLHYEYDHKESLLQIRNDNEKSLYCVDVQSTFFFPEILIGHGEETRLLPLTEIDDMKNFLKALTLLIDTFEKGICPICHNALEGERCPVCQAEVVFDEKNRAFVKNVPFIQMGGMEHA